MTTFCGFAVAVPFVMYKLGAPRVSLFMVSLIMALAFYYQLYDDSSIIFK